MANDTEPAGGEGRLRKLHWGQKQADVARPRVVIECKERENGPPSMIMGWMAQNQEYIDKMYTDARWNVVAVSNAPGRGRKRTAIAALPWEDWREMYLEFIALQERVAELEALLAKGEGNA